MFVSDLNTS